MSTAAPHTRLLLVGSAEAPAETEFAQWLRSLERSSARILASRDIFVLPSRSERFPCTVLEALLVGLPCVAACVGGIPELIRRRHDGLLVDREDVRCLADTLTGLLQDRELRQRLSTNGRKSVQQFGLDETTERMLDTYERLLAKAKLANGSRRDTSNVQDSMACHT